MQDDFLTWFQMLKDGVNEQDIDYFLAPLKTQEPNLNSEKPILKPGGPGLLGCMSRLTDTKGHFEATQEVLESLGIFEPNTILNIARASRLPDLLYFEDLRYHAQSTVNKKCLPIDKEKDLEEFRSLFHGNINYARESLSTNKITSFFYYLGIILHMVQDLATHQGMSNPEHAYLDKNKHSPDNNIKRFELSKKLSTWVLEYFMIEEISRKLKHLNSSDIVKWSNFYKMTDFLKLGFSGSTFKINALKERHEDHISRWFLWAECESHDTAINRIIDIIK